MARAMAGLTPAAHSRRHVAGARVRRPPRAAAVPSPPTAIATWRHARAMSAAAAPSDAPPSGRADTAAVAAPAPTAVRLLSAAGGCLTYRRRRYFHATRAHRQHSPSLLLLLHPSCEHGATDLSGGCRTRTAGVCAPAVLQVSNPFPRRARFSTAIPSTAHTRAFRPARVARSQGFRATLPCAHCGGDWAGGGVTTAISPSWRQATITATTGMHRWRCTWTQCVEKS